MKTCLPWVTLKLTSCGAGAVLGRLADLDAGLVEAVREVVAEDGVAVAGEGDKRERLARARLQERFDVGGAGGVGAGQGDLAELLLRAFLDLEADGDGGDLGFAVGFRIGDGGGDLGLVESVGAVDGLERLLIGVDELLAVAAAAVVGVSLLHLEALPQKLGVEVLVAGDIDRRHPVLDALVHLEDHGLRGVAVRGGGFFHLDADGCVEEALLLQEVLHVEGAFVQEIVVDGSFFEDRHKQMQAALRKLRADDFDLDDGSLLDLEGIAGGPGGFIVGRLLQGDRGFKTILLLEVGAQVGERVAGRLAADLGAYLEFAFLAELGQRDAGVLAFEIDGAHPGKRADIDGVGDVDLLAGFIAIGFERDHGFVVAVLREHGLDGVDAGGRVGLGIGDAGVQLAAVFEQRGEALFLDAGDLHAAYVEARDAGEDEDELVAGALDPDRDVAVAAGGEEAARGLANLVRIEGLTRLLA